MTAHLTVIFLLVQIFYSLFVWILLKCRIHEWNLLGTARLSYKIPSFNTEVHTHDSLDKALITLCGNA